MTIQNIYSCLARRRIKFSKTFLVKIKGFCCVLLSTCLSNQGLKHFKYSTIMLITFQSLSHTHGAEHFSNSSTIISSLPKILVAIHLNKQTILILLFQILKGVSIIYIFFSVQKLAGKVMSSFSPAQLT